MKKVIFFTTLVVCLLIIKNLVSSIVSLWQKQDLVTQAQEELQIEQEKNAKLKSQLSFVQTQQFVEEQARDKLFLLKPNEQEVVIPQRFLPEKQAVIDEGNTQPNWQKWLKLFF